MPARSKNLCEKYTCFSPNICPLNIEARNIHWQSIAISVNLQSGNGMRISNFRSDANLKYSVILYLIRVRLLEHTQAIKSNYKVFPNKRNRMF